MKLSFLMVDQILLLLSIIGLNKQKYQIFSPVDVDRYMTVVRIYDDVSGCLDIHTVFTFRQPGCSDQWIWSHHGCCRVLFKHKR